MIYALALILGAGLLVAGQAVILWEGAIGTTAAVLDAVALFILAIGIWTLKDDRGLTRTGRVGVVMVSFGTAAFATVALLALSVGVTSHAEIALTPFYLMAVLFLVSGLGALALYFHAAPAYPAALGWGFAGLALLQLARPFLAAVTPLHAVADLGLALGLLAVAVLVLRRRR